MGEVALRFLQAGLEGTKGTAVPTTRILMARITNPNFNRPREFPEEDRGTLEAANRFIDGVKDYTFSVETDASYEEIGWFFETSVAGSVAPTTINTAGKRYAFSPQTTAAGDNLQAATFQFGDDSQGYQSTYCEATAFTLGFDTLTVGQATPLKLSVDYVTKSLSSNTKTAGLTSPTVNSILATGANFYGGTTSTAYASLTEITGSLRSFTMQYNNGLGRKVFVGDGVTYSNIGRGRRVVTFDAQIEGDAANGVGRFVDWDLGTRKRMRIRFQGDIMTGTTPATTYKLVIDGQFVLTKFDPIGAVDTNTTYAISGRFLPDSALSDTSINFTLDNLETSYT